MPCQTIRLTVALALAFFSVQPATSQALPADVLKSVVSVLPVWPGAYPGRNRRPDQAPRPEGSGIILQPGHVVTAWHVVEPAKRIDIRLADGRIFPAQLIAKDAASDIAVLGFGSRIGTNRNRTPSATCRTGLRRRNAYGLGLSVTCGVVSALHVSNAGVQCRGGFRSDGRCSESRQFRWRACGQAGPPGRYGVSDLRVPTVTTISESISRVSVELLQRVFRDWLPMERSGIHLRAGGWVLRTGQVGRQSQHRWLSGSTRTVLPPMRVFRPVT